MFNLAKPSPNSDKKTIFQDFIEENGIVITDEQPPFDDKPEEVIVYGGENQ